MLTPAQRRFIVRTANTPRRLVGLVIGSWLVFGALFALLSPVYGLGDGLYLGTVVQSTLGFGDVLPTNWPTKILVMIYVWFCLYFVLPAAIFHVGDCFLASRNAFNEHEQAILKGNALITQQERMQRDLGRPVALDEAADALVEASKCCTRDDADDD